MTTSQQKPAQATQAEGLQRRRFTTREYMEMAEAGILKPGERVELVQGEILIMPPIGSDHGAGVIVQLEALMPHAPGRFNLWTQTTVHLGEGISLEPDLAVLKFRQDRYAGHHPTAEDIVLIIEDARSSLAYDRDTKSRLYAMAGIPETWVVDLQGRTIERFTGPGPEGYQQHTTLRSGERISPVSLPDIELEVNDLLPPVVAAVPAVSEEPAGSEDQA